MKKILNGSISLNSSILITTKITIIVRTSRIPKLSGYNGTNLVQRNEPKENSL